MWNLIWWSLRKKGIPEQYVAIIQDIHDTQTRVKRRCDTTEYFDIEVGLHQGSVLSPLYIYTKLTQVEEFVCPPNISETVAVRTVKLAHRPHIASTTIKLISKLILLSRKYHIRNVTIREKAHIKPINTFLMKKQLSWFGRGQHCKVCSKYSNRRILPQRKTQAEVDGPIERRHEEKQYTPRSQKSSLYYICIMYWRH